MSVPAVTGPAPRYRHDAARVQLVWSERCLMSTRPSRRFPGASSSASASAVLFAARFRLTLPPR